MYRLGLLLFLTCLLAPISTAIEDKNQPQSGGKHDSESGLVDEGGGSDSLGGDLLETLVSLEQALEELDESNGMDNSDESLKNANLNDQPLVLANHTDMKISSKEPQEENAHLQDKITEAGNQTETSLQNKTKELENIKQDLQKKTGDLHNEVVLLQKISKDLYNKSADLQNNTSNLENTSREVLNATIYSGNKTFQEVNQTLDPWEKFGETGEPSESTKSIPWSDFLRYGMSYNMWNLQYQGWHPSWYPCREFSFNNTCTYYDPRKDTFGSIELSYVIDMVLSNWIYTYYPLVKDSIDVCCGGEPFYLTRGKHTIREMKLLGMKPVDPESTPERRLWDMKGKMDRNYHTMTRYRIPSSLNFRRFFFHSTYPNDMRIRPDYYGYAKSLLEWSRNMDNKDVSDVRCRQHY